LRNITQRCFNDGAWHSGGVNEPLWYFAYGSNMAPAIFVDRRGMRPSVTTWGWVDGYRLCFDLPVGPGERGVANVVPDAGSRTCGVLYRITPEEGERLDRSEGVHVGYYRRIVVVAAAADASSIEAFTYHSTYASPGRKPSRRYLRLLLDGARERGLPENYVASLRAFELAHDERLEHERG
jgi:cation transport regulator ChaC